MTSPTPEIIADNQAQELWALRFLDTQRLNELYELLSKPLDTEFHNEVVGWIDDYLEMRKQRDGQTLIRYERTIEAVQDTAKAEQIVDKRRKMIQELATRHFGEDYELEGLTAAVYEQAYLNDFEQWLFQRVQPWYADRFNYTDEQVAFLEEVLKELDQ